LELVREEGMYFSPRPYFIWRLAQPMVTGRRASFKQANMKKYLNRC
jgi:hypothetical protein